VKALTRAQLESRKEKAVRFTRDVLGDPDRAEEIADENLEDYAARRKIQLTNPSKRRNAIMARTKSKAELEAEIDDLKDENAELQDQLVYRFIKQYPYYLRLGRRISSSDGRPVRR
jgi:ribosomal protein L29